MLNPAKNSFSQVLRRSGILKVTLNRPVELGANVIHVRGKKISKGLNLSALFKAVPVKQNPDDINIGEELTGALSKTDLLNVLNKFALLPHMHSMSLDNGLNDTLLKEAIDGFRQYCLNAPTLPVDLHVVLSDILQGVGNIADIFPYFLRHAKEMFPHIDCIDDLKKISDLRSPANWYPNARSMERKIIFHAGPTNSGKTYQALERFMKSKSGIYCGPLKLLASEVYQKCNNYGTPCDLVTGEERKYARSQDVPSSHVACTVEMVNLNNTYEVAVIDEIQMVRDLTRGWAWTRALLGIPADEIHVCGEAAAIDLVHSICKTTGENVQVNRYDRLTKLVVENRALGSLKNIQKGDCIVCFSKNDIYTITRTLESNGIEVAVIYGSLPPNTKLAQAAKFNDPNNSCKVMVATDAIGMGLNLHIRRIIFFSVKKPTTNENGEKEMVVIPIHSALQIAGRAGRFKTQWETGFVTTFRHDDLPTLKKLLEQSPEALVQAGLHPTSDQIELYAYHLPNATLSDLMDIFVELSTVDDSLYFMCNTDDFKYLADMIQHISLPLRARYVFCCAPINKKFPFVCAMFLKFARQYSKNEPITFDWLCQQIGWTIKPPHTLLDLVHLESVFDVLDLYLWFSYRFIDLFPESHIVRDMQEELDQVIQQGIVQLTRLLKNNELDLNGIMASEDNGDMPTNKSLKDGFKNELTEPRGRLTKRLIQEGVITSDMLQELQLEWMQQTESKSVNNKTRPSFRRSPKILK